MGLDLYMMWLQFGHQITIYKNSNNEVWKLLYPLPIYTFFHKIIVFWEKDFSYFFNFLNNLKFKINKFSKKR
jgi:hypothetical protein